MDEKNSNAQNVKAPNSLVAAIEALLFTYGEPIERSKLMKLIRAKGGEYADISEADVSETILAFNESLMDERRGLALIISDDRVQLVTKPQFSGLVEAVVRDELNETLTPAALETLSIIAYAGPIPRSTIDFIRGVNSSFILRSLTLRGLVEREQKPGRSGAFRYRASFELLKYLGFTRTEDLPEYERFRGLVEKLQHVDQAPS